MLTSQATPVTMPRSSRRWPAFSVYNRLVILALLCVATGSRAAAAQGIPTIDPEDAINPIAIVEGAGVKVGEGTVLHPSVGVEGGFTSNVFYTDQNAQASALLRILGEVGTGSLPPQRMGGTEQEESTLGAPAVEDYGDFQYHADLRASYDFYPSTVSDVSEQGGLGLGALFRGIINPHKPLQVAIFENYQRLIRPENFESPGNVNRDINTFKLQGMYAPYGRSLSGILRYQMTLDLFEADRQQFADRFQNTFGFRLNWQWLPQTRLYFDISEGVYTGIGSSSQKVSSYPLVALVGIQTLLTPNVTLVGRLGYTNGFYSTGPSYSAVVGGAQLGYRFTPVSRITLLYNYLHNDSINANYYRDHDTRLTLEHEFRPFDLFITAGLIFREYTGLVSTMPPVVYTGMGVRDDTLGLVNAELTYNFRDWLAAAVTYQLMVDSTDYTYVTMVGGPVINPGYVQHTVFLGVRAAY